MSDRTTATATTTTTTTTTTTPSTLMYAVVTDTYENGTESLAVSVIDPQQDGPEPVVQHQDEDGELPKKAARRTSKRARTSKE